MQYNNRAKRALLNKSSQSSFRLAPTLKALLFSSSLLGPAYLLVVILTFSGSMTSYATILKATQPGINHFLVSASPAFHLLFSTFISVFWSFYSIQKASRLSWSFNASSGSPVNNVNRPQTESVIRADERKRIAKYLADNAIITHETITVNPELLWSFFDRLKSGNLPKKVA